MRRISVCAVFFLLALPGVGQNDEHGRPPGYWPSPSSEYCYLYVDIDSDPVGAHIYSDANGDEWGVTTDEDYVSGTISCHRANSGSTNCAVGFTAKKRGYAAAYHVVRFTGCRAFSAIEAKRREHIEFTMVLDPL